MVAVAATPPTDPSGLIWAVEAGAAVSQMAGDFPVEEADPEVAGPVEVGNIDDVCPPLIPSFPKSTNLPWWPPSSARSATLPERFVSSFQNSLVPRSSAPLHANLGVSRWTARSNAMECSSIWRPSPAPSASWATPASTNDVGMSSGRRLRRRWNCDCAKDDLRTV